MPKQRRIVIPGLPDARGLKKPVGDRVVNGINALKHARGAGAGETFELRRWQEKIVRELFSRLRPDGRRQYRTCYIEIPRKNGKTELAAAIALYMLVGDGEQGAEVICAAADREQASLVFSAARHFVETNERLSAECKVIASQKRIVHYGTGSYLKAISAEAYSKHGFNASAVIYDELHAAPNRELYDVLTTSMGARRQPLLLAITTAGWDRTSICWEVHDYAVRVRDGQVKDETFLPIIFAAGDDDDWTDEAVWKRCNPALDDFRSLEEMRIEARRAKEIPAKQNSFRRLYLNQWTQQDTRVVDMAQWAACGRNADVPAGTPCYAGLDLGQSDDFSAFVMMWPLSDRMVVDARFWLPESALRQYPTRPYQQWRDEGRLMVTPGDITDYQVIQDTVSELCRHHGIREVAYDKRFAQQLALGLQGDGITVVDQPQGFQLSAAATRLLELVASGVLVHQDDPILTWMAGNLVVRQNREGQIRPDKDRAGEKIDGMVALMMAIAAWLRQPMEPAWTGDEVRVFAWA